MAIIYCGELNKTPYYIKEADLNIYSLQELAYFIYNNPMLISNNFINKSLILFIKKYLNNNVLYNELANMYNNKNTPIINELLVILKSSNMYNEAELKTFIEYIEYLKSLEQSQYIKICADNLFNLKKYNKAISQYEKIINLQHSKRNIGYCYAKLLVFDKAINYLEEAYEIDKDIQILRDLYFCKKLSKSDMDFSKYANDVDENILTEWEYDIVKMQIYKKNSTVVQDIEDIFLMGENFIKSNINSQINNIKEKFRYIG